MRLLLQRTLPYVASLAILAGAWALMDLVLVAFFDDVLPTSWLGRSLITLAALTGIGVAFLLVVSACSSLLVRAHHRADGHPFLSRAASSEKMAMEGQLDSDFLSEEPETHRNIGLLRRVRN